MMILIILQVVTMSSIQTTRLCMHMHHTKLGQSVFRAINHNTQVICSPLWVRDVVSLTPVIQNVHWILQVPPLVRATSKVCVRCVCIVCVCVCVCVCVWGGGGGYRLYPL